MLEIRGLAASINDKPILHGIDLTVPQGEVHAIMGPNGSGKSTLAYVLSGREDYAVTAGSVTFDGQDLLAMAPEERAALGVFLAFQAPVELPGVGNANFLRTALNALRRSRGESELDAVQFLKLARAETKRLAMPDDMLRRNVNVGFSGGEKKRNEVLQMAILRPKLAILDETDSGLDIDALKIVADGVNALRGPEFSALVITHHQRLLDHIVPDRVHVLVGGRIVRSGGPELARELEAQRLRRMWRKRRDAAQLRYARAAARWARSRASSTRMRGVQECRVRHRGSFASSGARSELLRRDVILRRLRGRIRSADLPPPTAGARHDDDRRALPAPTASSRATQSCATACPATCAPATPRPKRSAVPACPAAASRRGNTPTCARSRPPRSTNR